MANFPLEATWWSVISHDIAKLTKTLVSTKHKPLFTTNFIKLWSHWNLLKSEGIKPWTEFKPAMWDGSTVVWLLDFSTYRIGSYWAPGFYFSKLVFGWGSIDIWPRWGCNQDGVLLIRPSRFGKKLTKIDVVCIVACALLHVHCCMCIVACALFCSVNWWYKT